MVLHRLVNTSTMIPENYWTEKRFAKDILSPGNKNMAIPCPNYCRSMTRKQKI